MNIGENIKNARKNSRLSQRELAEKLNVTKSTLSGYENNHRKVSIEMLIEISKLLNTSISELTQTSSKHYKYDKSGNLTEINDVNKKDATAIFNYNQNTGTELQFPYTKENYILDPEKFFEDTFILYTKDINSKLIYKAIYHIDDIKVLNRIINSAKDKIDYLNGEIEL